MFPQQCNIRAILNLSQENFTEEVTDTPIELHRFNVSENSTAPIEASLERTYDIIERVALNYVDDLRQRGHNNIEFYAARQSVLVISAKGASIDRQPLWRHI